MYDESKMLAEARSHAERLLRELRGHEEEFRRHEPSADSPMEALRGAIDSAERIAKIIGPDETPGLDANIT